VRESLASIRRSREFEPLLPMAHTLSAQVAFAARDFVLAAQFARQAQIRQFCTLLMGTSYFAGFAGGAGGVVWGNW
jgi:hypothetical protein